MFRALIVGPFAVLLGTVFALAFGMAGGAVIGACLILWPLALAIDVIARRLPRRGSRLH